MSGDSLPEAASANPRAVLQGLERALAVMERLAEQPMRASQLAEELGIKWATAHRTLSSLREAGCLIRDEATGVYQIGPRIYYLGSAYLGSLPVVRLARSALHVTAREMGATGQLVTRYRTRSVNLLVIESARDLIPRSTIDFHFPLHCGSKGQVLLAFAEESFIREYLKRPLEALTQHTIVDPENLAARLAWIRERDYAITKGDIQPSTGSVAAPIRDASGNVIASLTLIVPYDEFDSAKPKLIDAALRTAWAISTQAGWRPDAGFTASTAT